MIKLIGDLSSLLHIDQEKSKINKLGMFDSSISYLYFDMHVPIVIVVSLRGLSNYLFDGYTLLIHCYTCYAISLIVNQTDKKWYTNMQNVCYMET